MAQTLSLQLLPDRLAICRLPPNAPIPEPTAGSTLWSVTRTAQELSIVMDQEAVPLDWQAESGWRCLKVVGPLDFSLTGILAALVSPLAEAAVPVFTLSTFDTDYLLIKHRVLDKAKQVLEACGHSVQYIQ